MGDAAQHGAPDAVVPLGGLRLPREAGILRRHVRPAHRRSAQYLDRYDRHTLFYDCVLRPDGAGCVMTAPRLLNLWPLIRDGLRDEAGPVRPRRRRIWLRCEQIELPAPRGPLTLTLPDGPRRIAVRESLAARFAGLDCLVAVNRDNALDWIANWAGWHARHHGTAGVVIFDNGSTAYAPAEIAARLAGIAGLRQVAVISAPFPYGPADRSGRLEVSPRFFQTAMLNLARRDALAHARSVLSVDIDELVQSHDGQRVHDLAVRHPLGMVTVEGVWIYPPQGTPVPAPQDAHVCRTTPDARCNRKWCLRPGGAMDRFGWAVHHIGGVLQDLFTRQRACTLLHCRACSTGWKTARLKMPKGLRRDPALAALMQRSLPAPSLSAQPGQGGEGFEQPEGEPGERPGDEGRAHEDQKRAHAAFDQAHVPLQTPHHPDGAVHEDRHQQEGQAEAERIDPQKDRAAGDGGLRGG